MPKRGDRNRPHRPDEPCCCRQVSHNNRSGRCRLRRVRSGDSEALDSDKAARPGPTLCSDGLTFRATVVSDQARTPTRSCLCLWFAHPQFVRQLLRISAALPARTTKARRVTRRLDRGLAVADAHDFGAPLVSLQDLGSDGKQDFETDSGPLKQPRHECFLVEMRAPPVIADDSRALEKHGHHGHAFTLFVARDINFSNVVYVHRHVSRCSTYIEPDVGQQRRAIWPRKRRRRKRRRRRRRLPRRSKFSAALPSVIQG
jgi:hypothetical protein